MLAAREQAAPGIEWQVTLKVIHLVSIGPGSLYWVVGLDKDVAMNRLLWALPTGIFSAAFVPELPPITWLLVVLFIALLALLDRRGRCTIIYCLLGFCYGALWGHGQLAERLPVTLDREDYWVIGRVESLPISDGHRTRFVFRIRTVESTDDKPPPQLKRLLLSWYDGEALQIGEQWQFRVRLRSPRSFSNPGSFDYSAWLLAEGISATGYIRSDAHNRRLQHRVGSPLSSYRHWLFEKLQQAGFSDGARGLMSAIILGEKALIPKKIYPQLVATGTVHLLVVSGLHLGMVTAIGFAMGMVLGRLGAACGCATPAKIVASGVALAVALAYGAIAGWGLPVQRALIMTAAVLCATAVRRPMAPGQIFAWALTAIAFIDPLAVIRPGFWLSFVAVAGLLSWFTPRAPMPWWRQLWQAQGVVFLALAPCLLIFQGALPSSSLAINLIAVPWVGFLVTPLCLAGALFQPMGDVGETLWWLAAWQLDAFVSFLASIRELALALTWSGPKVRTPIALAVLAMALGVFFLPRGLSLRIPAGVVIMALVLAAPREFRGVRVAVLDVGQGLAVVVTVGNKALVYDTGPAFSQRFDAGSALVAPFLAAQGITAIDTLVVSHGDGDHAGGVAGLLSKYPARTMYASEAIEAFAKADQSWSPCRNGQHWRWGDVEFRMIWPKPDHPPRWGDNDSSCVLLIAFAEVGILLAGDIEARAEAQLLEHADGLPLRPLSLLVAAHHGSQTSSSSAFVARTRPSHVVYSVGFNHHFGHPHASVVERYARVGSQQWSTAKSGALVFEWDESGRLRIEEHRDASRRYWHGEAGLVSRGEGLKWDR